jgi:threonyl-tRNA synthetase
MVRNILETFWKEIHLARGYDLMYTPHIAKVDLWKTSGHYQHYAENMFDQMQVRTPPRSLLSALYTKCSIVIFYSVFVIQLPALSHKLQPFLFSI